MKAGIKAVQVAVKGLAHAGGDPFNGGSQGAIEVKNYELNLDVDNLEGTWSPRVVLELSHQ